jgi:hypothetical protein
VDLAGTHLMQHKEVGGEQKGIGRFDGMVGVTFPNYGPSDALVRKNALAAFSHKRTLF